MPNEVCENKPVTRTNYVNEEECTPVTRQQCNNVVERVPRQSSRQVHGTDIYLVIY